MDIANKNVLVTGASGGIGRQLCRLLAEAGASLIMTGRNAQSLQQLNQQIGSGHCIVEADLCKPTDRSRVLSLISDQGGLDAVVNLAGVTDFALFNDQSPAMIEKILNTNLLSLILFCRELLPLLLAKPEAAMINVGSIFGSIGYPGFAVYCASKAGVKSFSEALDRELADSSLRVCYIAPRSTTTEINSVAVQALNKELGNRSDSAEYVAAQIIKLLKSDRRLSYLGWPEKFYVRVNAIFPNAVRRSLTKQLAVVRRHANHSTQR